MKHKRKRIPEITLNLKSVQVEPASFPVDFSIITTPPYYAWDRGVRKHFRMSLSQARKALEELNRPYHEFEKNYEAGI